MPKTAPAAHDQPKPCETTMPSKVAAPIWAAAPGQDDTLDGQQVFKMEVEAHAEHEQDDADFRALGSRVRIGDETGGIGAYNNACQQVTHNGGHA